MNDLISKLEAYKNQDNFPAEAWGSRGLVPSDDDVRQGMNLSVSDFAHFLISQLTAHEAV